MLTQTSCELCGAEDWRELGRKTYTRSAASRSRPYDQKRFKVFFDKWFPGQDEVTITSVLCRRCGFIIYLPRPEVEDINTKYRYLEELGQDYGHSVAPDSDIEQRRGQSLLRYIRDHLPLQHIERVLDYGGGDGRLMSPFRAEGKDCFLVDYNQSPVDGVTKLTDTIDDLDPEERFDLIFCSHVIEHVAEPLEVMKKLISHLDTGGHLFVEVPMEVWGKPPLLREPVTHINFFTRNSLENLLRCSGLEVLACELTACPHPSGRDKAGIRSISRKREAASTAPVLSAPDGLRLVQPGVLDRLRYHFAIRDAYPNWIRSSLSRRFGS